MLALVSTIGIALVEEKEAEAAPPSRASKVTICHRTRSTTNPYRRITVSVNAAKGGHTTHSMDGRAVIAPWTSGLPNGGSWGDIIPEVRGSGSSVSVQAVNYDATGTTAERRGYAIWNGSSGYENTCPGMSTKEFIRIHVESGGSLRTAMAELDDMAANEDYALRQSLGTTFDSWYTSSGATTDLATFESQLDAKTPSATTLDPTNVGTPTANAATLNGSIAPQNVALTVWFQYSTSAAFTSPTETDSGLTLGGVSRTSIASGTTGSVAAALTLSGLVSGTTYYYRVVARSTNGLTGDAEVETLIYGDIQSFRMGTDTQVIDMPDFSPSSSPYGTAVTVRATSKDSTTAGVETGLTVEFSSTDTTVCTVGASTLNGTSKESSATVTPVSVGTCSIRATQPGANITVGGVAKSYKAAASVTKSFTITAKDLTVSGVTTANKEYNGNQNAAVTCGTLALTGLVSGDAPFVSVECSSPSGLFASANVGTRSVTPSGITLTGGRASRYNLVFSLSADITPKGLTVTADDKTVAVGGTPSFSVTGSGLVGSDALDDAGTTYTFAGTGTTSYASSTSVPPTTSSGTYSITPSAVAFQPGRGSASNYTITYFPGTLTVAGSLTSQAIDYPDPSDKTFGDADFTVDATSKNGSTPTGLLVTLTSLTTGICTVGASALSGNVSRATVTIVSAGTCQIRASQSGGTVSATSYSSASNVTQSIVIAPKSVDVMADNKSKVFGAADPTFTSSATGLVSPATLNGATYTFAGTGSTSYGPSTTPPTAVGTYSITPSAATLAGGGVASDYIFSYFAGTYTISSSGGGGGGGGGGGAPSSSGTTTTTSTTIAPAVNAVTTTTVPGRNRRITICHWNASGAWVSITVDANSLNGHGDHPNDIIPAPTEGCGNRAVTRVLSTTTTTTVPVGSLQDTKNKVNEERKGGKDKGVLDVVEIDTTPKQNGGGGSLELTPKDNGPGVQLLGAKTSDPKVQVKVKSSGSDYNKPDTWVNEGFGSYCWKIESFNGEYLYTLPSPPNPPDSRYAGLAYSAVKVKAGSIQETDPAYQVNTIYMSPAPGSVVFADTNKNGVSDPGGQGGGTLGDKAISHVILCVGESSFPGIETTVTTVPGSDSTTTTTTPGGSTTVPSGSVTTTTTPGSVAATTTLPGSPSTTIRVTTTTVSGGSRTRPPATTTTTTPRSTTVTTSPGTSGTSTSLPGSSATTTLPGSTATTLPGLAPTTTTPGTSDPEVKRSSIEVEIIEPNDGIKRQSVDVEFVMSTGTDVQTVYLTVNLSRFSVETPATLTMLPETGTDTGAGRLWLGIGMVLVGVGLLVGRFRNLFSRTA